MHLDELKRLVSSYIGLVSEKELEYSKVDIKRKWWDLTTVEGINEFLRDTTAIANSYGPDGYIIIGFDPEAREYFDARRKDSKLKDQSQMINLVKSRVDTFFRFEVYDIEIEDHKLSVIHIPPSIDKPHIIKSYKKKSDSPEEKNRIFVRHGTTIAIPSKSDLELMFYDRKNIIPDYEVLAYFDSSTMLISKDRNEQGFHATLLFSLENTGRRPVSIRKLEVIIRVNSMSYNLSTTTYSGTFIVKSQEIRDERTSLFCKEPFSFPHDLDPKQSHNNYLSKIKDSIEWLGMNIVLANGTVISTTLVKQQSGLD